MKSLAKVLAAAVLFGLSMATAQAQTKTYKIGYILSSDSQLGAGASAFAGEMEKRSGGRIKIEQAPNATLGGEVEMLKGLQLGSVDLAFITGAPLANIVPDIGVFNIPFLFRDLPHAHAVLDGPIGQAALEKFRGKDMVALAWGENGLRHLTNSKRPIHSPEDLRGLKLRLPQSDVMALGFKALGADASSLPFPQVYGALQSGQFDGQENPLATIIASKFFQVQKYLTLSGHVYDPAVILISKDLWDEQDEAGKTALVEAAKVGGKASRVYAAEAQKNGVESLRKQGMEIVEQVDRAKFVQALQVVRPDYEKRFGAALIKQIEDTK